MITQFVEPATPVTARAAPETAAHRPAAPGALAGASSLASTGAAPVSTSMARAAATELNDNQKRRRPESPAGDLTQEAAANEPSDDVVTPESTPPALGGPDGIPDDMASVPPVASLGAEVSLRQLSAEVIRRSCCGGHEAAGEGFWAPDAPPFGQ
eukprot:3289749-Prymnesium_polylepis.1